MEKSACFPGRNGTEIVYAELCIKECSFCKVAKSLETRTPYPQIKGWYIAVAGGPECMHGAWVVIGIPQPGLYCTGYTQPRAAVAWQLKNEL